MNDNPLAPVCDNCSTNGDPFFCWISDSSAEAADSVREYPRGTVLFNEGQTPCGVYLLCAGRVKLSNCSGDARVLITDIAGPGYVLGLSAVVSGGAHETTAETLGACRLAFKLGRRVDWNVGYQYHAYKEKPPVNTGQDYRAHLPYTSLRIYFGGRE